LLEQPATNIKASRTSIVREESLSWIVEIIASPVVVSTLRMLISAMKSGERKLVSFWAWRRNLFAASNEDRENRFTALAKSENSRHPTCEWLS